MPQSPMVMIPSQCAKPGRSAPSGLHIKQGSTGATAAATAPNPYANLFIRKTGSDNNGGSSASVSPDATGADGVTDGTTTFVAASASFTANDVNKLINIVTKGRYRIVGFTNSTTVTLSGSPSAGSSLTWNLGGAVATIGALLANANAAVVGGDRIWIGAGTYRETVTIAVTPTFELRIEGDTDGAMTGDPGMVQWTAYTTDDKTLASATSVVTLNGKSNLTFVGILFVSGSTVSAQVCCINGFSTGGSTNLAFIKCVFIGNLASTGTNSSLITITNALSGFGVRIGLLVDRCRFFGGSQAIALSNTRNGQTDYDLGVVIQNSIAFGQPGRGYVRNTAGAGTGQPGGEIIRNCVIINTPASGSGAVQVNNDSRSIPMRISNCMIVGTGGFALNSNGGFLGAIVEDYNVLYAVNVRNLVQPGPRSIDNGSYAPLFHFGQEQIWGGQLRPFLQPMAGSPFGAFGGSVLAYDMDGVVRPAGAASGLATIGALERANSWGREIGVDLVSASASGNSGVWDLLSVRFTPTAKGFVTLNIYSFDTSGVGKAFADDYSMS